ncbi:MAG: TonB-dependent receptor [Chryseobacterium sp.]|nr:TonB-dependent receptor [Chryseobacterium sp.]
MKKITFSILLLGTFYGICAQEKTKDIEDIVIVGNRGLPRSKINSPVAVDVISVAKIQKSAPQSTVQDLLNYIIPSFNSVHQSASDGTEHIDPITLRGMGPDQVLVLINGKRRHTTSLVNYQNTVGNGSVGTDLSTIPVMAIDRIEVLRDGASAQYGSDAIAGVINIILKKNQGASASITYGKTSRSDGENLQAGVNYGASIGKDKGIINLTLQLSDRQKTNRTQNNNLDIFGNNFAYDFADNPAAARSADDAEIAQRGLTRDDFNFQVGDAHIKLGQLFLNAEYQLNDKFIVYTFGGFSIKEGQGYGFRRLPSETSNVVLSIYPNGFQPILGSKIYDISQSAGVRYHDNNWSADFSNTFGSNVFEYNVSNTNNASLGAKSPTSFYAGSHGFLQNTINLDISKKFEKINLAFGGEYRFEQYQIKTGEVASYATYDIYGNIANSSTNASDISGTGGSQSFTGFSPANALTKNRNSLSAYADVSYDIKNFYIDVATRFEHYSDFGNSINGKLAMRYEILKNFALRGGISSGFRAPSLQQKYFSNFYSDISTTGVGIVNKGIFNNDSDVAKALGFDKLKQEKSINTSLGFTLKPLDNLFITVDGYLITVKDRIVLTSQISSSLITQNGAEAARLFANAIDTKTKGVDVVATYKWNIGGGILDINLAGNYNETKITNFHFPTSLTANGLSQNDYFGPDQINIIESLSPKTKATLGLNYKINKINLMVRNTMFGKVIRDGFPFGLVQEFSPKVVTDVSLGYDFTKKINVTIGANNVFDVFPDKQIYENSYFGVFKYAPVQMGTLGAYFFGRINYNF